MASNTYKRNETDELLARIYDAAFAAGYSKRDAEIIRCRECAFYAPKQEWCEYELNQPFDAAPDHYCALGQSKEGKA